MARPATRIAFRFSIVTIDGVERAPLVTDYDRWTRVVFDRPAFVTFQRMDDTFSFFGVRIDAAVNSLALMAGPGQPERGRLKFDRPSPDRLVLDGQIGGRPIRMRLT